MNHPVAYVFRLLDDLTLYPQYPTPWTGCMKDIQRNVFIHMT
jgi:hypothetical protein